jgi:hypothetical protein
MHRTSVLSIMLEIKSATAKLDIIWVGANKDYFFAKENHAWNPRGLICMRRNPPTTLVITKEPS